MSIKEGEIKIHSRDYWFKVVDFLQQNWCLLDQNDDDSVTAYFFDDTSGVFDQIAFPSRDEAKLGLIKNGFKRYSEDSQAQEFIACPVSPFCWREHPNLRIYSSGRFWR